MASLSLNTPSKTSNDQFWIQWHKDLLDDLGKTDANSVFIKYWAVRGSSDANTHDLRDYAKGQGINIDASNILGSLFDTGADVVGGIGNFLKVGKYVGIGIAVVVGGSLLLMLFNIARNPDSAIGAASEGMSK